MCIRDRHWAESVGGANYEVLPLKNNATSIQNGLREELKKRNGLYIFYDTRGKALYAGKAKLQSLWKEMNHAFNRDRDEVQAITLVTHPEREQEFFPAFSYPRPVSYTHLANLLNANKVKKIVSRIVKQASLPI